MLLKLSAFVRVRPRPAIVLQRSAQLFTMDLQSRQMSLHFRQTVRGEPQTSHGSGGSSADSGVSGAFMVIGIGE